MSEAIERIVGAYVKLRNRKALEDLKAHRQRLVSEIKSFCGVIDVSSQIKQLENEIAVIDAGLAKLDTPTAAWASALGLGFNSRAS
jgi:hypothetical protein